MNGDAQMDEKSRVSENEKKVGTKVQKLNAVTLTVNEGTRERSVRGLGLKGRINEVEAKFGRKLEGWGGRVRK